MADDHVDFDEMAISMIEAGNDMTATFSTLRAKGATVKDCIHALEQLGFERSDANKIVAASPAWADLFALARANRK